MLIISLSWCNFIFLFVVILFQLKYSEASNQCGKVQTIEPRILGGLPTTRGQWPFLAALFELENENFFCGGTLISASHVMTAAHCIHFKDTSDKFKAEDIVVLLGAYNLTRRIEMGRTQRFVGTIHVHPDWRQFSEKYDADIAVLVLTEAVVFSRYIRPVCLPADDEIISNVRGSIAGWGLSENNTMYERVPRQTFIHALNNSYCYTTDSLIAHVSSTRTFCGNDGGEGGSPNKGDSGGGFFFLFGSAWVQHGIISATRVDAKDLVNVSLFSLYTKVKSFESWIVDIITSSGDSVATVKGKISWDTMVKPVNDEIRGENDGVTGSAVEQSPQWTLIKFQDDPFPINCHIGGYEKTWAYDGATYIGRVKLRNELLIGKYSGLGHKKFYVLNNEKSEDAYLQGFEVLCGGKVNWVPIGYKVTVDVSKFVQGGFDADGTPTYVCQATYFDESLQVYPGSYRSSTSCCEIDVRGDHHCQFEFKLLQLI